MVEKKSVRFTLRNELRSAQCSFGACAVRLRQQPDVQDLPVPVRELLLGHHLPRVHQGQVRRPLALHCSVLMKGRALTVLHECSKRLLLLSVYVHYCTVSHSHTGSQAIRATTPSSWVCTWNRCAHLSEPYCTVYTTVPHLNSTVYSVHGNWIL